MSLKKLEEFRDNMHKKTYLRKVTGSDSLLDTLNYVIGVAKETHYEEKIDVIDKFHSILFRICSRSLNRIGWDDYDKKDEESINSKFAELCQIKNHYWKTYLCLSKNQQS